MVWIRYLFLENFLWFIYIYIIGRAGNGRVALQIILEKLNDIEEAIMFCRGLGDQSLWTILIEQSKDKPGKSQNIFKFITNRIFFAF